MAHHLPSHASWGGLHVLQQIHGVSGQFVQASALPQVVTHQPLPCCGESCQLLSSTSVQRMTCRCCSLNSMLLLQGKFDGPKAGQVHVLCCMHASLMYILDSGRTWKWMKARHNKPRVASRLPFTISFGLILVVPCISCTSCNGWACGHKTTAGLTVAVLQQVHASSGVEQREYGNQYNGMAWS